MQPTSADVLKAATIEIAQGKIPPAGIPKRKTRGDVTDENEAREESSGLAQSDGPLQLALNEDGVVTNDAPMHLAQTDAIDENTGALSSGDTTDDTSLVLAGNCESGSTVNVYDGTTLLGKATVTGTSWSYAATVADGTTYQFNAKETDATGNTSAATSNSTVIGDATAPTLQVLQAPIAPVTLEATGVTSGWDKAHQITAIGSDGAYAATWFGQDRDYYSIFVQAFNADGTTNGAPVQLEATGVTNGYDYAPQITAIGSGGAYAVTWYGKDSGGYYSIFVQAFNADGTTNGAAAQLTGVTNGYNESPQITAVGSGGAYAVTWYGEDSGGDYSIFVQAFNADGTTNGAVAQLEPTGITYGDDYAPRITAFGSSGTYVVTWYGKDSENNFSIFVQAFNADGTFNGAAAQLTGITGGSDFSPSSPPSATAAVRMW